MSKIKPGSPVDSLVCPRGHHSVEVYTDRIYCHTCNNQGRETTSWDRSELVDLREEEPPLRGGREIATDGGRAKAEQNVANARAMLSGFEIESLEEQHGAIKHAIAELQNARRSLPDEY